MTDEPASKSKTRRVIITHQSYGCDTGCCGHVVTVDGKDSDFLFTHPHGEDFRAWAEALIIERYGEDHVKDIDWVHTIIVDD